jgi:RND family efflux transporter MFP subunit
VPESSVPSVHIGQRVEVRVPTLNRSFPGLVARFTGRVTAATRTMDTEVDVPNPNLVLMPGMYAEVNLAVEQRAGALAAPVTAIGPGNEVMVVTPENRLEVRKVQTGMETADKVEIKSGLNKGDLVVVAGRSSLRAGEEVKPKILTLVSVDN